VLVTALGTFSFAQDVRGKIEGTAVDMQGAVFSNVSVLLVNLRTLQTWKTQTDGTGRFRFEDLQPGRYELLAAHHCFVAKPKRIKLKTGETVKLSMRLNVDDACSVVE